VKVRRTLVEGLDKSKVRLAEAGVPANVLKTGFREMEEEEVVRVRELPELSWEKVETIVTRGVGEAHRALTVSD
jgi:hypothetical protein